MRSGFPLIRSLGRVGLVAIVVLSTASCYNVFPSSSSSSSTVKGPKLKVPKGWKVSRDQRSGKIRAAANLRDGRAPVIEVDVLPMKGGNSQELSATLLRKVQERVGTKPKIVAQGQLANGQGLVLVAETTVRAGGRRVPARCAILLEARQKEGLLVVGTLIAETSRFNKAGGRKLLERVVTTANLGTGRGGTKGQKLKGSTRVAAGSGGAGSVRQDRIRDRGEIRGGANPTKRQMVGKWTVSEHATDFNLGGVNLTDSSSVGFRYLFRSNGTYELLYRGNAMFGVQRSGTKITEVGRYRLAGDTLLLDPKRFTGWIFTGIESNKANWDERRIPDRKHRVRYFPKQRILVIGGAECPEYRVDGYCSAEYDFPFEKS